MKVYKGYQFRSAVDELILKVAASFGIKPRIFWSSAITTAGIDRHNRIYIANVRDDAVMTHADLIKWAGFGVHEILHSLYTDFDVRGNTKYEDALHNAVEDAFIEHKGISLAVTGNVKSLLTELIEMMTTSALDTVKDWSDPRQYPFVLAIYLRDHATTKIPLADGLEPIFAEAKRRLNKAKNSNDTYEIANWVYLELLKNQQDDEGKGADQDQGDNADGDNADKGQPKGNSQGDSDQDGDGDADAGDTTQDDGKEAVGKAKPIKTSDVVNPEPTLDAKDNATSGTYSDQATKREVDFSNWQPKYDLTVAVPAKLRYEVRRLFENSGIDEFQRNRRSGAVNVHALPSHSFNDKLFKLRRSEDGIDTACVVLIDASGSMIQDGGYDKDGKPLRMLNALRTGAALMDTLRRAQVSTAVMAFGDCPVVIKDFNTSVPKALDRMGRMIDFGATNDYIAVRSAHSMLLNRPEQRKICFVITDGEGDRVSTKEQCEIGARLGITTIGIGIDLSVSDVYPQAITVSNMSELAAVSFNKIKLAA
jgi:cobalamin biosynthesis protein CobT